MTIYEQIKQTCRDHDTTLTAVLNAVGRSDGSTGNWKRGQSPRLDIIMEIAEYLHISIDELVYGNPSGIYLSPSQREWLEIIDAIPASKQDVCKAFLRTHMTEPQKYQDKKSG